MIEEIFTKVISEFASESKGLNIYCAYASLNKLNKSEVGDMPTITLSMPEDLKQEMDESKFINWSEVAREAIRQKLAELALLKSIVAKSKLSEKDAAEIGNKISESLHKKYRQKFPELV